MGRGGPWGAGRTRYNCAMTIRRASCSCGQLTVDCAGDPKGVSICHCLECQQRSGSVFATQARYAVGDVTVAGDSTRYERKGDSGGTVAFHFCPRCGSTVYWQPDGMPEFYIVAVGAFADPGFPAPSATVYEARRHAWVAFDGIELARYD